MTKIVIVMDGGLIQEIMSDRLCNVMIIDHDTDGADYSGIKDVPQMDGSTKECYVSLPEITYSTSRVNSLYEELFD